MASTMNKRRVKPGCKSREREIVITRVRVRALLSCQCCPPKATCSLRWLMTTRRGLVTRREFDDEKKSSNKNRSRHIRAFTAASAISQTLHSCCPVYLLSFAAEEEHPWMPCLIVLPNTLMLFWSKGMVMDNSIRSYTWCDRSVWFSIMVDISIPALLRSHTLAFLMPFLCFQSKMEVHPRDVLLNQHLLMILVSSLVSLYMGLNAPQHKIPIFLVY